MKKLLVTAILTAVCSADMLGDETFPEAQVYDVKITVKTTIAKRGKLSPTKNPFVTDGSESIIYRKQGSQSYKGLVWGCDCESIFGIWGTPAGNDDVITGAVIWNTKKPYSILLCDDMHWHVMNAIDQKGDKCECAWTIGESTDDSNAFLSFAGFGKLVLKTEREDGNLTLASCGSYIKSVSGNVTGWMPAPFITTEGREEVCTFCGVVVEGEEASEDTAVAWQHCECNAPETATDYTAVSGTWSIKYNASLSKKLANSASIFDVYKSFPSTVKARMEEKIAEIKGEDDAK